MSQSECGYRGPLRRLHRTISCFAKTAKQGAPTLSLTSKSQTSSKVRCLAPVRLRGTFAYGDITL
jgi:hypothetical protein